MASEGSIRINTPNVVGEEFEGEVVVVNLESGCYFSLLGSAKQIWKLLTLGGASPADIIARLENDFDCSGIEVAAVVSPFLDDMLAAEILVSDETPPSLEHADVHERADDRPPFESPRMEVFSDLQDILLLDPIHDVDEAGWPVATDNNAPL